MTYFEECMAELNGCANQDLVDELPSIISSYRAEFCLEGEKITRLNDCEYTNLKDTLSRIIRIQSLLLELLNLTAELYFLVNGQSLRTSLISINQWLIIWD